MFFIVVWASFVYQPSRSGALSRFSNKRQKKRKRAKNPGSHFSNRLYFSEGGIMETAASLNDSGIALTEANRPYEAIPLFRKALIMDPGNPLLWMNLGIAQQRTGDYDEALNSFQRAVFIDDDLPDAWVSM
jgi:tetratricopeptide (TPR) repeat protein